MFFAQFFCKIVETSGLWRIIFELDLMNCEKNFLNIKHLAYLKLMNDDFHNNSSYLWKFWQMHLRKFYLLTKRVFGRIETFSMSAFLQIQHVARNLLHIIVVGLFITNKLIRFLAPFELKAKFTIFLNWLNR